VDKFGFVTIIKPGKGSEVDSVNVFMGIAAFSGIIETKAFFFRKIKNAFLNSTGLKNVEELQSCHRRSSTLPSANISTVFVSPASSAIFKTFW